jgi:hypothetical protein
VSEQYFDEAVGHALSGRVDLRAADYNLPSAVIGNMISRQRLSQHSVRRLLLDVAPSMRVFLQNHTTFPFNLKAYNRRADRSRSKRPLAERRRCRLAKYLETFKARTSAWVTTANVLYADRLLNLDLSVDHEFYLSILLQRMRTMFSQQLQSAESSRRRVELNQQQILRVLVCGVGGGSCSEAISVESEMVFERTRFETDFVAPIKAPNVDKFEMEQYDPNQVTPSMIHMVEAVVSRVDIRDMLQSKAFFDVLLEMGPDLDELDEKSCKFEAFSSHKYADSERIPNDFDLLWREIGCKGNMVHILRALCAVSIVCHSNKSWQENVHWFGDDKLKQLFNDPLAVLRHIHQRFARKWSSQKWNEGC